MEGDSYMLVLSRKIEEKIRIGDNIQLAILGIQNGQVKIGVQAPKEVPVHREEVKQKILQTN